MNNLRPRYDLTGATSSCIPSLQIVFFMIHEKNRIKKALFFDNVPTNKQISANDDRDYKPIDRNRSRRRTSQRPNKKLTER